MTSDVGRYKVFEVDATLHRCVPVQIAPAIGNAGSATAAFAAGGLTEAGSMLITASSFVSMSRFASLNLADKTNKEVPNQIVPDLGLSASQVSEMWYESEGRKIHTFVMRPSTFDETKKYPLALLIHGGPWAAWLDSFNPRWNASVFAEQGYVVVLPNVTGKLRITVPRVSSC